MTVKPGSILTGMGSLYLIGTLAFAALLLLFLLRPGAARPMVVWGISALLPLLAAMVVALNQR
ncbi:hypothetical protein GCM10008960_22180 [Deinococcus sedimenti]|uniref:Uncharacterized protein n=2 Tax=Deinococcus sedimenti TaxID=1867090 RepID=A0ABQ2S4T0_9DEIO|nr:hypothetical protein GCM10008960_22180 [Deinococcus sedimenti]